MQATNPLPTNPLESFTYDEVGNRVNSNQNGASIFNQANQLTEDSNFTYQYDANGNQTRKTAKVGGALTSYEYDAENKPARVVSNGTVADYRYDGLGRRVEKQVTQGPTTNVTRYIYDNEDILLELDGSNNITARYTHGSGIDEPLIMEKAGASFFYHADGLGSITEITDSAGIVKQQYTYSSFGKIESRLDPNFIQPYAFTSREFDPETGLYFYRARTYDPATGRFLQEDLIGFRSGDINHYAYVGNNPVNFVDPTGLTANPCCECPSGRWSGVGLSLVGTLGNVGGAVSVYQVSCWDNNKTCLLKVTCVGGGGSTRMWNLGGGFAGESMWSFNACNASDLEGEFGQGPSMIVFGGAGIMGAGGSISGGSSTSITYGAGFGAGVGFLVGSCKTSIINCF